MKIGLVGSSGGHLTHLYMLKPTWSQYDRFWVTFDKQDARILLEGERVYPCYFPTNRNIKNLIKNAFVSIKVLRKEKPDILISSGAAVAVPFFYIAIIIPGTIIVSLGIAYAIQNLSDRLQTVIKIIFYLTSIVSQVALVMVWKWMFNPSYGMYATLCEFLNIPSVDLLGNPTYSLPLLSILVMSFTISQPIILFASAIDGIPNTYFEAAALDGASRFKTFCKITLPMITPTIIFVLVTTTINNLQVFVVPQLMTNGGPNGTTTPILLLIYRQAFEYGNFGYAFAMGIILFAIIAIFVAIQFKLTNTEEE